MFFAVTSCSNEEHNLLPDKKPSGNEASVNIKGKTGGASYAYENVIINPNVVGLNEKNATLLSSKEELTQGVIKVSDLSQELSQKLIAGNIVYIQMNGYTNIRKIVNTSFEQSILIMETSQSGLEELFDDGSLEISFDIAESVKTYTTNDYSKLFDYTIVELNDEYKPFNGFMFNPNTYLGFRYSVNMSFKRVLLVPMITAVTSIFELESRIVPTMHFETATNLSHSFDLIDYTPEELINFLKAQEFSYEIPIPDNIALIGGMTIPVALKISDIHIPVSVEANLGKEATLGLGFEGIVKMGYEYNASAKSISAIYSNELKGINPTNIDINGEILSSMNIEITPEISILSTDINAINGELSLGINSITKSTLESSTGLTAGSIGFFEPKMKVEIDLLGLLNPSFDIPLPTTELWNIGTINKNLLISSVSGVVTNSYKANLTNRDYKTNLILNYEYPGLPLKKISSPVSFSYDVYASNGSLLVSKNNVIVELKQPDIRQSDFGFSLDVPFRRTRLIPLTYDTQSVMKNIRIKDKNGYECSFEGEVILKRP